MSCCGANPAYDELDEVSRLVSSKLAAFLRTLRDNGFAVPNVCTPEELMGDVDPTNV